MINFHELSLQELRQGLDAKDFTAKELAEYFLKRIEQHSDLNAFLSVSEEAAFKQAEKADQRIQNGDASLLTGIPISLKDVILTKGTTTTAGSNILKNFVPPYDATVTKKLEQAGYVSIRKEFQDSRPRTAVSPKMVV